MRGIVRISASRGEGAAGRLGSQTLASGLRLLSRFRIEDRDDITSFEGRTVAEPSSLHVAPCKLVRFTEGRNAHPLPVILDGRTLPVMPKDWQRASYDGHKRNRCSKTSIAASAPRASCSRCRRPRLGRCRN